MSGKIYFEKESSTILDKIKDKVKCIFNGIKSIWSSVWEFIKGSVSVYFVFVFGSNHLCVVNGCIGETSI